MSELDEITVMNKCVDINNEIIRSGTKILCQVLANGVESMMYLEESLLEFPDQTNEDSGVAKDVPLEKCEKLEWGGNDTKLLLDLYHQGLPLIGPLKTFRNKKSLWIHIGKKIEKQLGLLRTVTQCESCFKTIMKRKTAATVKNHTSGETRVDVPYEDEIDKIKAQDDSLDPEILMSGNQIKIKEKENLKMERDKLTPPSKNTKQNNLVSVLENLHQKKEEAKERRHREKMELIRELFRKDYTDKE